jgi:hypothetical protein
VNLPNFSGRAPTPSLAAVEACLGAICGQFIRESSIPLETQMKKLALIMLVTASAAGAFAQGTVFFNNRIPGSVVAPIYGHDPTDPSRYISGNGPNSFPVGTTDYTGARRSRETNG